MKRKRTHYLTLLLGCMLAVVMVCSQFFRVATGQQEVKNTVKTEQTENTDEQNSYISLPSFSLPSPVHVQINLDSHCLFEILYGDKEERSTSSETPNFTQKLFVTLFQVIISPNAP